MEKAIVSILVLGVTPAISWAMWIQQTSNTAVSLQDVSSIKGGEK